MDQDTLNHCTECGVPNGGVRERTKGAEEVCNPIGRTTKSSSQTPKRSQGLNHKPRTNQHMALAAYVSEDSLVRHQWEERVIVPIKVRQMP